MRRLIALGAVALLVLAAVPFASAGTTVATKHVDGSVEVTSGGGHVRLARFEVRATPSGVVQFGYMTLYGIGGGIQGTINEMAVDRVEFYREPTTGALGAKLFMREWSIVGDVGYYAEPVYDVTDGATVGQPDTFLSSIGWHLDSGNISIYSTSDQNAQ